MTGMWLNNSTIHCTQCTSIPHSLAFIPVKNETWHYPDYCLLGRILNIDSIWCFNIDWTSLSLVHSDYLEEVKRQPSTVVPTTASLFVLYSTLFIQIVALLILKRTVSGLQSSLKPQFIKMWTLPLKSNACCSHSCCNFSSKPCVALNRNNIPSGRVHAA